MRPGRPSPLLPLLLGAIVATGCADRGSGVPLTRLTESLDPGERLLYVRALEPETPDKAPEAIVAVVEDSEERLELRVYEDAHDRLSLSHRSPGGERFRNVDLIDVNADGRRDIVATWEGGHLTILEVFARRDDRTYQSIFQNAGREVEIRHAAGGGVEFFITSRTYEEGPGQPPIYESERYRWDGDHIAAVGR